MVKDGLLRERERERERETTEKGSSYKIRGISDNLVARWRRREEEGGHYREEEWHHLLH